MHTWCSRTRLAMPHVPPSSPRGRAPSPALALPSSALLSPCRCPSRTRLSGSPRSLALARTGAREATPPSTEPPPLGEARLTRGSERRGAQAPRLTGDRRTQAGRADHTAYLQSIMSSATVSFRSWYGIIFMAHKCEPRWFKGENDDFGCHVDGQRVDKSCLRYAYMYVQ